MNNLFPSFLRLLRFVRYLCFVRYLRYLRYLRFLRYLRYLRWIGMQNCCLCVALIGHDVCSCLSHVGSVRRHGHDVGGDYGVQRQKIHHALPVACLWSRSVFQMP